MSPALIPGEFVYLTVPGATYGDLIHLRPLASISEAEGMTVIVPRAQADREGAGYDGVFRVITLRVNSSLHSVGLTAAVSRSLAEKGIAVNVLAAFHHDHLLVPADRAEEAQQVLNALSSLRHERRPTDEGR